MTPAAMRALTLALSKADGEVRALIEIAIEADATPTPDPPRSRKAKNQKAYRDRKEGRESQPSLPGVTAGVTAGVTESGNGNGNGVTGIVTAALPFALPGLARVPESKISLYFPENREREGGSETRAGADGVTAALPLPLPAALPRVTASVTGPVTALDRPTNLMADGCFGNAVAAWAQGIGAVTGKPFAVPRGGTGELAKLIDGLTTHCPEIAKREAFARERGEAFARAYRGKLSAHSFVDWLNSPEAPPAPVPASETPAAKERRARENAQRRAYVAAAVPPPRDLLAKAGFVYHDEDPRPEFKVTEANAHLFKGPPVFGPPKGNGDEGP